MTVAPQVSEKEKLEGFVPLRVLLEIVRLVLPVLVRVLVNTPLDVETGTVPKFNGVGAMLTIGTPADVNTEKPLSCAPLDGRETWKKSFEGAQGFNPGADAQLLVPPP